MRLVLLIGLLICYMLGNAQFIYIGVVKNEQGKALEGISVFINNSSVGTVTNKNGSFRLAVATPMADVVFTGIGYQTKVLQVEAAAASQNAQVVLKMEAALLDGVVVQTPLKDGWEKWGTFFLESFLGETREARECILENRKQLKFYFDKATNTLTVRSAEPLIITNKALGYRIQYKLEEFRYEGNAKLTFFSGYPFFNFMKGGAARQRQWAANRQQCYTAGLMHFFRSLYRNKLAEEGFILQPVDRYVNAERARVKLKLREMALMGLKNDSTAYYDNIMSQPDSLETIGKPIPADSVAFAAKNTIAGFYFENLLLVSNTKIKMNDGMIKLARTGGANIYSYLRLLSNEPIYILQDGSYYDPSNLLTENYWAISEKIARMLPFDYEPLKN